MSEIHLTEQEREALRAWLYEHNGSLGPNPVTDGAGGLAGLWNTVESTVAARVAEAEALADHTSCVESYSVLLARAEQAEKEKHGPGGFWTRAEWAKWSNTLALLIPEEYDDDAAQEAIIERALADLARRAEQAEAKLARVRELADEWGDFEHDAVACQKYDCGDCTMVNAIYDLRAVLGDGSEG